MHLPYMYLIYVSHIYIHAYIYVSFLFCFYQWHVHCKSYVTVLLKMNGLSDQWYLFASGHWDTGTSGPQTRGNAKIKKHHKFALITRPVDYKTIGIKRHRDIGTIDQTR